MYLQNLGNCVINQNPHQNSEIFRWQTTLTLLSIKLCKQPPTIIYYSINWNQISTIQEQQSQATLTCKGKEKKREKRKLSRNKVFKSKQ